MKIGNCLIGNNKPVFIIAEACDNHFGNMSYAKQMAEKAFEAGADAIKYQFHIADEEMLPDIPMSDNFQEPLYEFLKKNALTLEQHIELMDYCDKIGIVYLCTPFSYKAAKLLNDTNRMQAFKIGSGEMTDIPSLLKIAKLGKPLIISTGMSSYEEIEKTVLALKGYEIALTNCVSEYPPNYKDLNLNVISVLKEEYSDLVIGHSDHTPDLYTSYAAVGLGAKIIEKHVILDKSWPGPDQSVSINFDDLKELVIGIRKIEKALGYEKKVHVKEKPIRSWAFRSLVSIKDIKRGEYFSEDNIWSKRPGTGIQSIYINDFLGKKSKNDIKMNTLLTWNDV